MKIDIDKDKLLKVFIFSFILFSFWFVRSIIEVQDDYKNRMYYDFKNYKEEIEKLNEKLFGILVIEEYDNSKNNFFINDDVLIGFEKSKLDAGKMRDRTYFHDYQHLYRRVNIVMDNVLEDGIINKEEYEYINMLYDYNEIIINEFNKILSSINGDFEYKKVKKDIAKVYDEFSIKADEVLNTINYSELKDFNGEDFSGFNYQRAEDFVVETFSKVVPGQSLNYNNKNDLNNEMLIFTTHAEGEELDIRIQNQSPQYKVKYNKQSKEVEIRLIGAIIPSMRLTEEELDSIAQEIISKFNYKGYLFDRKIVYDSYDGKLSSIEYTYKNKIDDVYDQQQEIKLELEYFGFVRELYIVDNDNKVVEFNFINSQEIINKINEEAVVKELIKFINVNGEEEYLVQIIYEGINYDIVFDGNNGNIKKYKRTFKWFNHR